MVIFVGKKADKLGITFQNIDEGTGAIPVNIAGSAYTDVIALHVLGAETANFTTDGVDVTNFDLAYLHLVITAVSGTTPRMILEVETSYDNSNWVHRRTICDKTTAGDNVTVTGDPVRGKLEATGTCICYIPEGLGKYIRLKGTLTGTSPSFTFSCYGSAS